MSIWDECAKIAEDLEWDGPDAPYDNGGTRDGWHMACTKIAEEIRKHIPLCEDCPPIGYPTDKTRCTPCPRRQP